MKRTALALATAFAVITVPSAQTADSRPRPGDRPAANPHGTRSAVLGRNGMIATSQPLASAAGLKVLQDGGNAIDAAVTAAAVLAVVEPSMTGIGGDLFAIVYDAKTKTLRALNASGRSRLRGDAGGVREAQPGADPECRRALGDRARASSKAGPSCCRSCGTIPMSKAVAPAIDYAKNGYAVSEIIAGQWKAAEKKLAADPVSAATFLPGGHAPEPGEVFANPQPRGDAAEDRRAADATRSTKGRSREPSSPTCASATGCSKSATSTSTAPTGRSRSRPATAATTSTRCRRTRRGRPSLEMLNILEGFDLKSMGHNSPEYLHLLVEAKRIAFADRAAYIGDPDSVPADVLRTLISKDTRRSAARRSIRRVRRRRIRRGRSKAPVRAPAPKRIRT